MKLTVYQAWCGPRPTPGPLAVVVSLISSRPFFKTRAMNTEASEFRSQFHGTPIHLKEKGHSRERRMPESSRALLIRPANRDRCPVCHLPAKTSRLEAPNHFCNAVDHKRENLKFCSTKARVHVATVQFSAQIISVKLKGKSQKLSCASSLS